MTERLFEKKQRENDIIFFHFKRMTHALNVHIPFLLWFRSTAWNVYNHNDASAHHATVSLSLHCSQIPLGERNRRKGDKTETRTAAKRRSTFRTSHHFNMTACLMEKFIAIETHYFLCEASVSFEFILVRLWRVDWSHWKSNLHTKLHW